MQIVETMRTRNGVEVSILSDAISYTITASTGYKATVPACPCADGSAGDRTPCPLDYGHSKTARGRAEGCVGTTSASRSNSKSFCHEWHLERVQRLRDKIAATYGRGICA